MTKKFSAGVLVKDNQLLLGLRSKNRTFYPNVWDFIGGHCEENESFEDALKRELQEEINIVVLKSEHLLTIDKSPEFIMQIFVVFDWQGEITNLQPNENEEITWFTFDEARALEFPDGEYFKILQLLDKLL